MLGMHGYSVRDCFLCGIRQGVRNCAILLTCVLPPCAECLNRKHAHIRQSARYLDFILRGGEKGPNAQAFGRRT